MNLLGDDLEAIEDLMKQIIKDDVPILIKNEIGNLPTRDLFTRENAKLMKELKDIREEQTILSGLSDKVNMHDEEIKQIQKKLQITTAFS